jgi:hypothetical protein
VMDTRDESGVAITTNTLLKWGGFIGMAMGGLVTLILWGASVRSDQEAIKERIATHERDLIDLRVQQRSDQKSLQEMRVDLSRAVTILERIDKQLGQK